MLQNPASFHKFYDIDPVQVYLDWFAKGDEALKKFREESEVKKTELWIIYTELWFSNSSQIFYWIIFFLIFIEFQFIEWILLWFFRLFNNYFMNFI